MTLLYEAVWDLRKHIDRRRVLGMALAMDIATELWEQREAHIIDWDMASSQVYDTILPWSQDHETGLLFYFA